MDAAEQQDERQEEANDVCGVVLIHAEEVSLVEHLHLQILELGVGVAQTADYFVEAVPERCRITGCSVRLASGVV